MCLAHYGPEFNRLMPVSVVSFMFHDRYCYNGKSQITLGQVEALLNSMQAPNKAEPKQGTILAETDVFSLRTGNASAGSMIAEIGKDD